jgi:hypothetical protein
VVTNEKGFYRFAALPPGSYTLVFSLPGFATLNREGVRVQVGQTSEANVSLKLSTLSEEVTVEGIGSVVDTTSNQVSTNYGQEWVKNAPVPRYTFFDLINAARGQPAVIGQRAAPTSFGSSTRELLPDGRDNFTTPISSAWPYPSTDAIEGSRCSPWAPASSNLRGGLQHRRKQGGNTGAATSTTTTKDARSPPCHHGRGAGRQAAWPRAATPSTDRTTSPSSSRARS